MRDIDGFAVHLGGLLAFEQILSEAGNSAALLHLADALEALVEIARSDAHTIDKDEQ